MSKGQADKAIAHWRRALQINPDFEPARRYLDMALAGRLESPGDKPLSTSAP